MSAIVGYHWSRSTASPVIDDVEAARLHALDNDLVPPETRTEAERVAFAMTAALGLDRVIKIGWLPHDARSTAHPEGVHGLCFRYSPHVVWVGLQPDVTDVVRTTAHESVHSYLAQHPEVGRHLSEDAEETVAVRIGALVRDEHGRDPGLSRLKAVLVPALRSMLIPPSPPVPPAPPARAATPVRVAAGERSAERPAWEVKRQQARDIDRHYRERAAEAAARRPGRGRPFYFPELPEGMLP